MKLTEFFVRLLDTEYLQFFLLGVIVAGLIGGIASFFHARMVIKSMYSQFESAEKKDKK
jgi:hypothetical protein